MTSAGPQERPSEVQIKIADAVRAACVKAALDAYENAQMDGLCQEGAWEVAVGAMRALDVTRVVQAVGAEEGR